MNEPQNVLLIDDHPMVNSGIKTILEETGRFRVTGQANTLEGAKLFITNRRDAFPFLIILDIILGEDNGLDFLPFLNEYCNDNEINKPPVLICSVLEEPYRIQSALDMGAAGFISKVSSETELLQAIDSILRGEIYISGEHSVKVAKSHGYYSKFTKREMQIINLIKRNKTNKQIAIELRLSIRTIENHISNIYYKTGTKDRQEIMVF